MHNAIALHTAVAALMCSLAILLYLSHTEIIAILLASQVFLAPPAPVPTVLQVATLHPAAAAAIHPMAAPMVRSGTITHSKLRVQRPGRCRRQRPARPPPARPTRPTAAGRLGRRRGQPQGRLELPGAPGRHGDPLLVQPHGDRKGCQRKRSADSEGRGRVGAALVGRQINYQSGYNCILPSLTTLNPACSNAPGIPCNLLQLRGAKPHVCHHGAIGLWQDDAARHPRRAPGQQCAAGGRHPRQRACHAALLRQERLRHTGRRPHRHAHRLRDDLLQRQAAAAAGGRAGRHADGEFLGQHPAAVTLPSPSTACLHTQGSLTRSSPPPSPVLPQRLQGMPNTEKVKIVDDVITELGLESTRDTYIGTWHLRLVR